jgi:hypothetical protein
MSSPKLDCYYNYLLILTIFIWFFLFFYLSFQSLDLSYSHYSYLISSRIILILIISLRVSMKILSSLLRLSILYSLLFFGFLLLLFIILMISLNRLKNFLYIVKILCWHLQVYSIMDLEKEKELEVLNIYLIKIY